MLADPALLDEGARTPAAQIDDAALLITAGSSVPVERTAVLFAKIRGDTANNNNITLIRARALFAPALQSECLLPVSGLTTEGVSFRKSTTDQGTLVAEVFFRKYIG